MKLGLTKDILHSSKPLFISMEGGEGVGKSTQLKMLTDFLHHMEIDFVRTREPGGCESAEELRSLLVTGHHERWDGVSEALLYTAARNEHLRHVIRPSLTQGKWVITDRFADSTTVYQGYGRDIQRPELIALHDLVVKNTWPDLTIILDADVAQSLARTSSRQGNIFDANTADENRFESLDVSFHERVRAGFLQIAQENPERCYVIDAIGAPEEVHARILEAIYKKIGSANNKAAS